MCVHSCCDYAGKHQDTSSENASSSDRNKCLCTILLRFRFFSNFHHEGPSGQALSQLLCSNIAGHDISHVNCICFFQFMQLYSHFGKCVDKSICSFLRNRSTLLRHWSLQVKQGVLYAYSKWTMYHHILVLWYSSCVFAFESACNC